MKSDSKTYHSLNIGHNVLEKQNDNTQNRDQTQIAPQYWLGYTCATIPIYYFTIAQRKHFYLD